LRRTAINGARQDGMAHRISELEYQCGLADAVDEDATTADILWRDTGDNVQQAYVNANDVRTRLFNNGKDGAAVEFFQECASDLFLEKRSRSLIQLKLVLAGPRSRSAGAAGVWPAYIAVFNTEAMEHDLGNAAQVNVFAGPDSIHDGPIDAGQPIVRYFGIFARLKLRC
jgi:hypothetical protein